MNSPSRFLLTWLREGCRQDLLHDILGVMEKPYWLPADGLSRRLADTKSLHFISAEQILDFDY
jgi:hypothetical protein